MTIPALKARAGACLASRYVLVLAIFLLIPLILVHKPDTACAAAAIAPTPCDPTYYQSLENRAWLEAQREITQNQNLIFKPDSVLSYTCFEQYLGVLANQTQNMFSESTRWGNNVLGSTQAASMDIALANLVLAALIPYLDLNFHGSSLYFLGGRGINTTPPLQRSAPTLPTGSPPYLPNGYSCQAMNQVWMEAKCYDFMDEPDDGFFTFENYRDNPDKRAFPTRCTGAIDWANPIIAAGLDPASPPPWPDDATVVYFNLLNAATSCAASVLIPTGITVIRTQQTPTLFSENACSQAGCHYLPTSSTAGSCVP